ncbi:Uu.00g031920.m01.CDS01 [Anthostomella pinea]|uniref:NmrA-like family domain-containing protein 1 n=1 Tax=Anthostomella pinea TaxID=933095 RepID=A0AAI8YAQ4_9PEZI|nr:Uu.00g031920.m01.CDS01 [Anthostomella pinea]
MSAKKIITVFGATGAQGGAVVSTFLSDPKLKNDWAVRGVTRDASKDSAKKLAEKGVEVVAADSNDKASLVKAMSGSDTVFAVTNYWEKPDMKLEEQQGRNLADAAKEADVQHFIWSTLLNITELTKGKLSKVYHFDSKAHVEDYVRSLGIPASFFMPGYYMSNITGFQFTQSPPDNAWTFSLPIAASSPIPMYDTADTGKYVKAMVLNKDALLGKRFIGTTAYMTAQEVVDGFKKAFPETGKTARFYQLPEDTFRGYMSGTGAPDFVVDEMYENMVLMQDFGYYGGLPLDETHKYVEDHLTTWEEHMKAAKNFAELE